MVSVYSGRCMMSVMIIGLMSVFVIMYSWCLECKCEWTPCTDCNQEFGFCHDCCSGTPECPAYED